MEDWVPPGFVTWHTVIERAGATRFRGTWNGKEQKARANTQRLRKQFEAHAKASRAKHAAGRGLHEGERLKLAKYTDEMKIEAPRYETDEDTTKLEGVASYLRDLFAQGKLTAVQFRPNGLLVPLPLQFWHSDRVLHCLRSGTFEGRPIFVRAEGVDKHLSKPATVAVETNVKQWFREQIRGPKTKNRDDYVAEMQRMGVSGRGALRIWNALAPPDWKAPGKKIKAPS